MFRFREISMNLNTTDQRRWLTKHIPHRIRAALPGLRKMKAPWNVKMGFDSNADAITRRCIGDSVWEGRLAALRWLILFVGVSEKSGLPVRPKPHSSGTDVFIEDIAGGKPVDLVSRKAKYLAQIYKGCSQASSHATDRTKHPKVNERQLVKALSLVLDHLQRTIYAQNRRTITLHTLTPKDRLKR